MRKPRALRPAIASPSSRPPARSRATSSTPALASCARSVSNPCLRRERVRATRLCWPGTRRVPRGGVRSGRGATRRLPRSSRRAAATAASSCCRCSIPACFADAAKAFIGYSDNTSLLTWLTPDVRHRRRFMARCSKGGSRAARAGYDRDTFIAALCRAAAGRRDHASRRSKSCNPGEAAGMLVGGTLTQL